MEKHLLSKSTFIRGVQCLKSLYLHKNRYFLRDRLSPKQLAKFKRGTDVGVFAQNLFPGGVDCKPKSPSQYRKSVEKTSEVIEQQMADVIYEATFQFDRVLILLDILAKENGKWNAYEVKSSLKISDTYLMDAALQYYVLTNSGIEIDRFFLVHINPEYVFQDALDISELFTFVDVTDDAISKQEFVKAQIEKGKEALVLKSSPKIDIGPHCNNPYPCDFIGHCWKHIPKQSVFELSQWTAEDKHHLYKKGITKIEDIPESFIDSSNKKLELQAKLSGKAYFDADRFKTNYGEINNKITYAGFLGNRKAIPQWKNYKPYDIVPISLTLKTDDPGHVENYFNSEIENDPDKKLFEFLDKNFSADKSIFNFDSQRFEELLRRMAERNPEMAQRLNFIIHNIVDLKKIFDDFIYFNPKIGNNLSIQNIHRYFSKEGVHVWPFLSETLAINAYLKYAKDESENAEIVNELKSFTQQQTKLSEIILEFFKTISKNENH